MRSRHFAIVLASLGAAGPERQSSILFGEQRKSEVFRIAPCCPAAVQDVQTQRVCVSLASFCTEGGSRHASFKYKRLSRLLSFDQ